MNKGSEFGARKKVLWAAEALGLVLAYVSYRKKRKGGAKDGDKERP